MTPAARFALLAGYLAAVIVAGFPVLAALIEYSRQDVSASHLPLIPLVTVALIVQGRRDIFREVRWGWRAAVPLLAGGIGLAAASMSYGFAGGLIGLVLGTAAVVALATAGFVLFIGAPAARAALFPLGFLVFMVPIPPAVLDAGIQALKSGSTQAVAALFTLTATPYYREGFVFSLPAVTIEIADECSGIRSSIALVLTSLLAGHQFLDRTWSRVLLVLLVFPVTVLKNGIRIVSLTLMAVHVDPSFLAGRLHHDGGIVFFLLALGMLTPFLALLRRSELGRRPSPGKVATA
jgi:exosortase